MKQCVIKKSSSHSFNVMIGKMIGKRKFLSVNLLLVFVMLILVSQRANSQSVINPNGSCVGMGAQYSLTTGVCTTASNHTTWSNSAPAGSYTFISSDNNNYVIKWNTPVTGAIIKATYYLLPNCTFDTRSITVNVTGPPSTPTAPSGTLSRCQGAGTSQYTASVSSGASVYWSIANAGSSSINSSTGLVTWDANFSGTAVISVQASNCAGSATSSSSVTVTPSTTYTVVVNGPTQSCFNLSSVSFTAVVNNNQNTPALGTLKYQWYVDGTIVSGNNPIPGSNGFNQISNITVPVNAGSHVYCTAYTYVGGCVASSVTSAQYIVPTPTTPSPPSVGLSFSPTSSTNYPNLTYCQGTSITFTASAGLSNYQWSMNGGPISVGVSGNTLTTTAMTVAQLQSVSVSATSTGGGCTSSGTASAYADGISFVVIPVVTPVITITGPDMSKPSCLGTSLSFATAVSNGGTSPSLQWRINGGNVASETGNTFSTPALSDGQHIDCILTSNAMCATSTTATSNQITVATLPSVGTPGVISGPTSTPQQGTSSYSVFAANATGYNWSISPAGVGTIDNTGIVTWSNVNIFSSATISVTAAGCNGPSTPATLQVTLLPPLTGGIILSGNVTITPGSTPGRIVASPAYGGTCSGNYQYQWQKSSSPTGSFTDIAGANAKTYLASVLPTTTYFQRKVTCGTDVAFSNIITVTVGAVSATNQNYVRERLITKSGVIDFTAAGQLTDPNDVQQKTSYVDGLGNPIQTVARQASPSSHDMISMNVYDPFQRESVTLLGYADVAGDGDFKGNAANDQNNFNLAQFPGDQYYYNQTDFEMSPLGRQVGNYSQGLNWVGSGRGILSQYLFNTAIDSVRIWNVGITSGSAPVTPGAYPTGQLYKNVSTDEHGYKTIEYKDNEGHVILKKVQLLLNPSPGPSGWVCTYYLYDDVGNLRYVFQPELCKKINKNPDTYVITPADLTSFSFQYNYDARQRMATKQVPGAGVIYLIYDNRDRLVMTQDANQRVTKQWLFTKYDVMNRPVLTGMFKTDVIVNQSDMQMRVNTFYASATPTNWYETLQGSIHGYTNNSYPKTDTLNNYLTVNYYDNYDFNTNSSFNYLNTELPGTGGYAAQETSKSTTVIGQVTGAKTRMISSGSWLKSVNYYDGKNRLIQQIADNIKGHTITTTAYDFTGKPSATKTSLFTGQPVTWTNVSGSANVSSSNNISFSGTAGDWVEGASSLQYLPPNTDGWIEATVPQASVGFILGFGDSGAPAIGTVDFGWYVGTGQLNIGRGGNIAYGLSNVVAGDVLRVERINGKIYYKKNGLIVYPIGTQTADVSTAQLYFYAVLRNTGAKINNVVLSNTFSGSQVAVSTVTKRFTYDHASRLKETWHTIGIRSAGTITETTEVLLASNAYNELGQLIDKKLHSTTSAANDAKQSVDYRYNIRGWLTSINNADLIIDPLTNDDNGDLFGMNLAYDNNLGTGNSANPQYNGNINAIKWNNGLGKGTIKAMAYNFTYDAMNRLKNATHVQANLLNTWATGQYDERGMTYDLNGNIKTLRRKGAGRIMIDSLNYDYGATTTSNQLLNVTDLAATSDKAKGFYDGSSSGDYTYDLNGNLTVDKNKNLVQSGNPQAIFYNYLNLPEKVAKYGTNNNIDNIVYLYDATGTKQSQVVTQGGNQKVTEYVGPWVFENNVLQFVQHDEGRIVVASEQKLYSSSCDSDVVTPDFVTLGSVTLSPQTTNGETYVKVTCTASMATGKVGVMLNPLYITGQGVVTEGERYLLRVKGYFNGAFVTLYAKGNNTDLVWPGTSLSRQAISESWVEQVITIPAGVTQLTLGVLWNASVSSGDWFLINEVELYKVSNSAPEYQYDLKDHLGNVRVTFTTQTATKSYSAGFETANQTAEAANFKNYPSGGYINTVQANANTGTNSQLLNGGYNGQVGLAKSFSVMPGDQIQIQATAKYGAPSSTNTNYTNFVASLLSAFSLSAPAGGETGTPASGVSTFGNWEIGASGDESKGDAMKAFVTIVLFDKNYKFIDVAYKASSGSGTPITQSYTVKEAGYAYVYISNEHPKLVDVYFDDVTTSITPSAIVQQTDYYPFGMVSQTFARENLVPNLYQYTGKEIQDEMNISWLDYGARMYDPVLGRWLTPDLLSEFEFHLTPYRYCYNNPISYSDPLGLWERDLNGNYSTSDEKDINRFISYLQAEEATQKKSPDISQINSFIGDEKFNSLGKLSDGSQLVSDVSVKGYLNNIFRVDWYTNQQEMSNAWHEVQGQLTPDALDVRTLRRNLLGTTYAGGDNPTTYSGYDDFSYQPSNIIELPAIIHDHEYDDRHARGFVGLISNTDVISADWKFVASELLISNDPRLGLISQLKAKALGYGLGALALPKTIIYFNIQAYKLSYDGIINFVDFTIKRATETGYR